ncbi:pyridoxamine 5'-phosphate oxidase family protein [Microbacterium sp.]|uniref:pyridoxamine 5'-phosphate oxidase family protein n=1 Tax=Microbacterium sp. TaxID=51671 RepID=UPI003C138892
MTSPLPLMAAGNAAERAARILLDGRFITMSTADTEGPWAAPAQYRLLDGGRLYIESNHHSRHARAIVATGIASGAIFDSSAQPVDADGIQLLLLASEVAATPGEVRDVLTSRIHPPISSGDVEAEVAAVLAVADKRLYLLEVAEIHVFDREAWRTAGTDARGEVDAGQVFAFIRAALGDR